MWEECILKTIDENKRKLTGNNDITKWTGSTLLRLRHLDIPELK